MVTTPYFSKVASNKSSREKRYHRYQLILTVTEFLVALLFLVLILAAGFAARLELWIRNYSQADYAILLLFILILGGLESILLLPLSFLSGYILEHRFNLSDQSLSSWIWEKTKGILVSTPLLLILLVVFYFLLSHYPVFWWLIMGTVMILFSVVLARLAPILIFPLFYKFKPLEDAELARKVTQLSQKVGLSVKGVFQFNLSKTTKKGNAAFTGIGKSKRIVLGDTLLERLDHPEILAILAHELGHFKLKHIWKSMGLSILLTYTGLYLVSRLYLTFADSLGFQPAQIASLPLIALLLALYQFLTMPLTNAYSRFNERQADDFALELSAERSAFISGLNKLADQNLADRTPHPLVELLFYSHPPIQKRIARLK